MYVLCLFVLVNGVITLTLPWRCALYCLMKKIMHSSIVTEFRPLCWHLMFVIISLFTRSSNCIPSWASWFQATIPQFVLLLNGNNTNIIPSIVTSSNVYFFFSLCDENFVCISNALTRDARCSICLFGGDTWWRVQIMSLVTVYLFSFVRYFIVLSI